MDQDQFIVKDQIEISADKAKVWEVLTTPAYIAQWDDIPEAYAGGKLQLNTVLEWEGYSRLTVVEYEEFRKLSLKMYLPKVDLDPSAYNVCYTYRLSGDDATTILEIEIGDYAPLPFASDYVEASQEWAEEAKLKIKSLAEQIA